MAVSYEAYLHCRQNMRSTAEQAYCSARSHEHFMRVQKAEMAASKKRAASRRKAKAAARRAA